MHYKIQAALVALMLIGCDGEISRPSSTTEAAPVAPFEAESGRMRRLTEDQYRQALVDVFGEGLTLPATVEGDDRRLGLVSIGHGEVSVSPRGVEQYEDGAFLVAEQVTSGDLGCEPTGDGSCEREYLRRVGRRLFRRPLQSRELQEVVEVASRAATMLGEPRAGLQYAIAALLQSPHFLFRFEVGEETPDGRMLTGWEHASRLSYFLWSAAPDDELLDAAARGDLRNPALYAQQVDRMLEDPRARRGVRAIFADIFELDELLSLSKDATAFPHMSPDVGPSAREETLRVVEWLTFDEPASYRGLFTTRTTFINRKLASIYGVRAPTREGFARFEHEPSSQRSGILGHVSVLALHSHFAASSATLRGIFVRRTLLCGEILAPPPDVDTSIPEPMPGAATLRDRVRRHLEEPSCAGCHRRMDPLGLGLENFDAIGRHRTTDNGALIDASGNVDGVFFRDPSEFGQVLASSEEALQCAARKFYRYAQGHRETSIEEEAIVEIYEDFAAAGHRVLPLMRAVATHPSFRLVGEVDR